MFNLGLFLRKFFTKENNDSKRVPRKRYVTYSIKNILSMINEIASKYNKERIVIGHCNIQEPSQEIIKCFQYFHLHNRQFDKSIEIWFYEMKDKSLEILGNEISENLPKLEQLSISLWHCYDITDNGIAILGSKISRNLTRLKKFSIRIYDCHFITDNGITTLGFEISRFLVNLQELSLDFSNLRISDFGLAKVGSEISRHLPQLQCLSINCGGCDQITDQGLETLGKNIIKGLKKLQQLNIDCYGCHRITKKNVESIGLMISERLTKLQEFTIAINKPVVTNPKEKMLCLYFVPKPQDLST